jgi:hypothetical protein
LRVSVPSWKKTSFRMRTSPLNVTLLSQSGSGGRTGAAAFSFAAFASFASCGSMIFLSFRISSRSRAPEAGASKTIRPAAAIAALVQ